mgnify:CR=1 FL=1
MVMGVHKHQNFVAMEAYELFVRMRQFEDKSLHVSVEREMGERQASTGLTTINYNVKFHVGDYRFSRRGRAQWLDVAELGVSEFLCVRRE